VPPEERSAIATAPRDEAAGPEPHQREHATGEPEARIDLSDQRRARGLGPESESRGKCDCAPFVAAGPPAGRAPASASDGSVRYRTAARFLALPALVREPPAARTERRSHLPRGLGLGARAARATLIGQIILGLGLAGGVLALVRFGPGASSARGAVAIGAALLWWHQPYFSLAGAWSSRRGS